LIAFQVFFVPLHSKHQEQSHIADSPTEFKEPRWSRYDVED